MPDRPLAYLVAAYDPGASTTHWGMRAACSGLAASLERNGFRVALGGQRGPDVALAHLPDDASCVVFNAEGTLHHSAERPHVEAWAAAPARYGRDGLPCYAVNATLAALDEPTMLALGRHWRMVAVRETTSMQIAHGLRGGYGSPMLHATPDASLAAWGWQPVERGERIVVTDASDRRLSAALRELAESQGWRFVPLDETAALHEALRDNCRGLVTGRFHGACMAMSAGLPFVAVGGNTHKLQALCWDATGSAKRWLSASAMGWLGNEVAALRFADALEWTPGEADAVRPYVEGARSQLDMVTAGIAIDVDARNRRWP